jgi:hypothetical protein
MPKLSEDRVVIAALGAFAIWIFVGLPLLFYPFNQTAWIQQESEQNRQSRSEDLLPGAGKKPQDQYGSDQAPEFTIFGIKLGEGLLVFFTFMLWFATRNLVKGTEKTAERQLRAYVFVRPAGIHITGEAGGKLKIKALFHVINSGQTPAYNVRLGREIRRLKFPLPADLEIVEPTILGSRSLVALAAGIENKFSGDAEADMRGNLGELAVTGDRLYVVGIVRYLDCFQKERKTEFCISIANFEEVILSLAAHNPIDVEYEFAERYNEAT